ncbi:MULTISPECIES: DUF3945 domain-containing protein [unclassified Chryseobacterium]|uniref:DUF3945 domain-containing protein n=1 Tax=unclassified Chryseobacterium TaxID=2593645 RepID=UPI00100B0ACC|nr:MULTISPECIES: DUF3945 domain-containing protein [unclassified Chryseobacterium]RXM53024.1 hypothetical protein BOQ64_01050 [Chryseobacterium sp. CH25]RXM65780.1 hypothetical protein BOQ60_08460 [Chryseobacterium sp. CH1]
MEDIQNTQNQDPSLINILLVLNPKTNKIEAVKTIDEKGDLKTVPNTQKNQNQFLKIDKQGDLFSNFFSNFLSQLKDPTLFNFFKSPLKESEKIGKQIQHHLTHPSTEGEEFLNTHKILTPKTNTMSTNPLSEKEYQYSADQIDWNMMSKFGLTQEKLEKENALDPMLKGFKTNGLVPVTINLGTALTRMDARLSLNTNDEGDVVINIHGIRKEPNFNFKFLGHEFTAEDKKNLMENGNMGRVVDLINPKNDEIIPSVISRDRLTNELVAYKVENIKIPNEIKGIKLNEEQKQTLIEGQALYLEGMISTKGEPFNARVQFNADKKYVEFLFDHKEHQQQSHSEVPRTFRGKDLNEEQYEKFKRGQTIYLDELLDKKGQPYQGYITLNQETGKVDFSFQNPNKVREQTKPTEGYKTQTAVNSEGRTNETTKNVKEPLLKGQQSPKDNNQQDKPQSRTRRRTI